MAQSQSTEGATQVVEAVKFSFMTDEEVRKHSFLKVTSPILLDNVERPVPGGLYDPILGPLDDRTPCKSCGLLRLSCPGHCGHIELVSPVYHPLLFHFLHSLLQMTCFFCRHFRIRTQEVERVVSQLNLIIKGDVVEARLLNSDSKFARWSDSESGRESTHSEHSDMSYEFGLDIDSSEKCRDPGTPKQRWTSLQFSEATAVLNAFLKLKTEKCKRCKAKNPKVRKPTFGWFHRAGMTGSAIGANIIQGLKVRKPSSTVEDLDNDENDGIDAVSEAEDSAKVVNEFVKHKNFSTSHLLPTEVKEILKDLWQNEFEFCSFIGDLQQCGSKKVDHNMFFLESILVPPIKFRAPTKGGASVMEHPQTVALTTVLESNISLGNAYFNKLEKSKKIRRWMDLQQSINVLFDSKTATARSQREASGICQLLEKKEGLFRQKMMGKRVNHACRSVISPDPYIAVNEIGIPPYFALKLTYPERVTPWNVEKLREAIINGPDIHPGATHYSDRLSTVKLPPTRKARIALARKLLSSRGTHMEPEKACDINFEGKIVYRHMQDGDAVLVNRQPTLHKPSIMAHKVRVLKGEKTLRLHYANCSTYNADFDGDEMNVHFPQDEISRAEAYNIVNANNQYVRPSNGDPLRALIQDHVVSAVLLTKRDTFLDKDQFDQLLFSSGVSDMVLSSFSGKPGKKVIVSASDAELLAVEPAILKPVPLWTGKQVITAVLNHITKGQPPFTVEKATKLPLDFFKIRSREANSKSKENNVRKHSSKKNDNDESWKRELDEDKLLINKNDFVRGVIDKAQFADYGLVHIVQELYGSNAAGNLLSVLSRLFTVYLQMHGFTCGVDDLIINKDMDDKRMKQLEESELVGERVLRKAIGIGNDVQIDPKDLKSRVERIICSDGEAALLSLDRSIVNELNQCTSKGVMNDLLSDGLLKSTGKNCISLMTISGAKGSKVNFQQISSHLGQQDLEGKRVPRMVSGKTLPCFHPWDWSPRAGGFISDRFLSGLRPQEYYFHCMAGREGLVDTAVKTSRSGYLQRCLMKNLESLKVNYDYTVRDSDGSIIQFQYGEDGVDVHRTSFIDKFKELTANRDMILQRCSEDMLSESNCYITDLPVTLKKQAEKFVEALPLKERIASKLVKEELLKLVKPKYFASLAQPGEPVGVLAAQSVGEPSTQMTLNTFHLAGRGEMNVTLGIPRLQEILMTASADIKTPIMSCPLLKGKTKDDANDIADKLRKITVADIIEGMEVSVVPFTILEKELCSIHKLKMKLYKPEHYPKNTGITAKDWEETLTVVFLRALEDAIQNHIVLLSKMSGIKNFVEETPSKAGNGEDDGDGSVAQKQVREDEDEDAEGQDIDDLGSDAQKRKKQATDEMDYEESSDEEKNEPSSVSGIEDPEVDNEDEDMEISKEDLVGDDGEEPKPEEGKKTKAEKTEKKKKKRKAFEVKETDRHVFVKAKGMEFEVHFKFKKEPHILLAQIAQKTAQKVYIQNCGEIQRCTVTDCGDAQVIYYGENPKERKDVSNDEKKAKPALHAAGIDFTTFWELQDEIDVRYLYSNSIHAMLNTYGVEAARETIIREINHVFKSYGISVSIRHLNLIADYMTYSGGYRPMSRMGGIAESTSPFCRMSFETATRFIVQAATYGEVDNLETPSSRICLGLPVQSGTGSFDVLQRLQL
ncbi:PREDICTED: DNA-directed RNA polymerase I subunit 1 [Tarenaya hassleriana]|uniref:DNA-directed RNA polymerase I subunit 1 n=1 Tax=Tarenaya hassleriana TaxID=28532 RepID=UPI00053C45CC|nr:PREDICTED: DNA-directed RNA polymerase I subunit 1 [Tarenaya hassleriana]